MIKKYEVKYLIKIKRLNLADQIQYLGGESEDGSKWLLKQEEIIEGIEKNKWEFFIQVKSDYSKIVVDTNSKGEKFIKPEKEEFLDDFLKLPEFT